MSELPPVPRGIADYWPIHAYTAIQIAITAGIFVITTTKAAPVFPVIVIALVPLRLLLMKKLWNRETLRFVDAWACKEGTPEDDEDAAPHSDGGAEARGTQKRKEDDLPCV